MKTMNRSARQNPPYANDWQLSNGGYGPTTYGYGPRLPIKTIDNQAGSPSVTQASTNKVVRVNDPLTGKKTLMFYEQGSLKIVELPRVYDFPRAKTKNSERLRYEQHKKRLIAIRAHRNSSVFLDRNAGQSDDIPTKYIPSDKLVALVCKSSKNRHQEEMISIDRSQLNLEENAFVDSLKTAAEDVTFESVRNYITESVIAYLATLGRGLARGDADSFALTKNGIITDVVLKGFVYRIRIRLNDKELFHKYLSEDLFAAAKFNLLQSEYATVAIVKDEIVLKRLKTLRPVEESTWQRAEVFIPAQ